MRDETNTTPAWNLWDFEKKLQIFRGQNFCMAMAEGCKFSVAKIFVAINLFQQKTNSKKHKIYHEKQIGQVEQ